MGDRTQRRRPLLLLVGCAALLELTILSFLQTQTKQRLHTRGHLHAPGHFLAFALIEVLLATGFFSLRSRLISAGVLTIFGCVIEIAQNIVYGQPVEILDMQTDALGVLAGLLLVLLWNWLWDRLRNHPRAVKHQP